MKKLLVACLVLITVVTVTFFYYGYSLNQSLNDTSDGIYQPLKRGEKSELRKEEPRIQADEKDKTYDPISVLLLGDDSSQGDKGRTDTILFITLNPHKKSSYIVSIPRDTRTEIVGQGVVDKINHAYAYGGIDMTVDTVEQFLNLPIDYYAIVDMNGFVSIIDIFGGITVDVNQDFDYKGVAFRKGQMTLNGKEALAYARMREFDPRGDIGRNERQQAVLKALANKAMSYRSILKMDTLLQEVKEHVRTNQKRDDIRIMFEIYSQALKETKTLKLEGEDVYDNGIYYYHVSEEDKQHVHDTLKHHLELE